MAFTRLNRRRLLMIAGASVTAAPLARAQKKVPLKIMVGFAAGGSADQAARIVADQLGNQLGRAVIVENRVGAGGRIMIEAVKNAKPDGDTLMLLPHGGMTLFQHIYSDLRYNPVTDFAPIGRVATFEFALATGPATPAKSLEQFIKWAREPINKAGFGSPGPGTVPHLLGQDFSTRAKLNLTHVPYRGAGPSTIDLIGGNLALNIQPLADFAEYHKAGKVTVLGTTGSRPTELLPNIPTLKDSGIDITVDGWYGVYAPAGVPSNVQRTLSDALKAAAPHMSDALKRMYLIAAPTSAQELAQLQKDESAYWAQVVQAIGFKPQS